MNKTLKRLFPILLLIWPYTCVFFFALGTEEEELFGPVMAIYMVLTAAVYLLNIINVFLDKEEDACYRLVFWDMLTKLMHIPFYLIVFLLGILLLLTIVVPALVFVTPIMVGMLVIVDGLLMATTSVYGIGGIIRAWKKGLVTKTFAVVHMIMHCFFVTDVISAIIVYFKLRKAKKSGKADIKKELLTG